MAFISLILGESGSGKSRSILNLPPKRTFYFNISGPQKYLPFKNAKFYKEFDFDSGEGNMLTSKSVSKIIKVLNYISDNRPEIMFVILDDNQYLGLFTYTQRIDEKDWAKYNTITSNTVDMVDSLAKLRKNIQVYIMNHIENGSSVEGKEMVQAKTMGKFIKDKLTYEGLFTVVLLCDKEEKDNGEIEHFFWTRRVGATVKTPEGMFKDQKIPNDLIVVAKAIHEYYN